MPMKKEKKEQKVCVNLGCGDHIIPSTKVEKWYNVDRFLVTDSPDFLEGDARAIPLETGTVDYLICDQVLEHLSMKEVPIVLYEIKRVLKKGGRAVIIVPDFKNAAEQWLKYDHNAGYNPQIFHYLSEVIYGNQNHEGEYHRTPFSAGSLNFSCTMVGLYPKGITFYPEGGPIPKYYGVRAYSSNAILRNAQLVADIIKI